MSLFVATNMLDFPALDSVGCGNGYVNQVSAGFGTSKASDGESLIRREDNFKGSARVSESVCRDVERSLLPASINQIGRIKARYQSMPGLLFDRRRTC